MRPQTSTAATDLLTAADLTQLSLLIDGCQTDSMSDERYTIFDPSSGVRLLDAPAGSLDDVNRAVASARLSFRKGAWRTIPPSQKKAILHRWADQVQAQASHLDALDALEMGKPAALPVFNAAAAASFVRFNAEAIDKVTGDVLSSDRTSTVIQKRMPRGVVAAVVPWNFPTYNVVLKVAPALAAGNSVVLKPSELASQSAMLIARLALEAGLPAGVLNVVPGRGGIVGKALAQHMDVDMVTFTGSTTVGKLMLQYAGQSNLKVVSAECGGKSPQIVFDDGLDIDAVADHVAATITFNQGQVCSVGARLLVQESLEESLVQKVITRLERVMAGNPQLPDISYGPLVSKAQLEKVRSYIAVGVAEGADLVHGGARILESTGGNFIEPAVFVNVAAHSRLAQEEIFGPVLSVLRFRDASEAVELANSTAYGLAAYVWSARTSTAFEVAQSVPAAVSMINTSAPAGEGPAHAFSGEPHGLSGVGIEGGMAGLMTYTRLQTLWVNHG